MKQCLAGAAILLERCTWKGILYLLYYQYTFWEIFWPLCTSEQRGMCFDWVMIAFIFSGIIGKTIVNTWAWTIPSSREVLSWNVAGPFLSQHFVCAPVCVCVCTHAVSAGKKWHFLFSLLIWLPVPWGTVPWECSVCPSDYTVTALQAITLALRWKHKST